MSYLLRVITVFSLYVVVSAESSTSRPYPVYRAQAAKPEQAPQKAYEDPGYGYPLSYPLYSLPLIYGPIQTIISAVSKLGYVLFGGLAVFLVGGIFITAICSFTSICTIAFAPLASIDQDSVMRSFMTPEKLATAAALVQDAVGKYERLQKMNNG